jgi:hypothetical protein
MARNTSELFVVSDRACPVVNGLLFERDDHGIVHGGMDKGHVARGCRSRNATQDHLVRRDGIPPIGRPARRPIGCAFGARGAAFGCKPFQLCEFGLGCQAVRGRGHANLVS